MDLSESSWRAGRYFVGCDADVLSILLMKGVDVVHPPTSNDGPFESDVRESGYQGARDGVERRAD